MNQQLAVQGKGAIAVIGVPSDHNSSFLRGPALAPPRIRQALYSGSGNMSAEGGLDLGDEPRFQDLADLLLMDSSDPCGEIGASVAQLLVQDAHVLALGGDHAITHPLIRAHADKYPNLTILHIDAHPDLYDDFAGNPNSHASPFARIMEAGLASRLVQIGIRTMNPHQRQQAERFDVAVYNMLGWHGARAAELVENVIALLDGPLYLSLDLDGLDPAFAPGVSHHEPGGLSVRDVLTLIQGIQTPLVGADIVEYNPKRDPVDMTAMVAAKCLKEIAAKMIETNPIT